MSGFIKKGNKTPKREIRKVLGKIKYLALYKYIRYIYPMKKLKDFKKEILKDEKVKKSYDELEPEFELVKLLIKKRLELGLKQKNLAERIGTKQSAISRLESRKYNPSLAFLNKVAKGLGVKIKIQVS